MAEEPRMLSPRERSPRILAAMQTTRACWSFKSLPACVVNWHPGPEEWCVKEALGHIMEAERRGFNGRIRTILAEDEPDLEGWNQDDVERERNDCARDLRELLDEFDRLRADSVELVSGLACPISCVAAIIPQVGYVHVNDLLHEWISHDRNHVRQMLANVQSYVFP